MATTQIKAKSGLAQSRARSVRTIAAIFLAPTLILIAVYVVYPIIETFHLSGYKWNGMSPTKDPVGIQNWIDL